MRLEMSHYKEQLKIVALDGAKTTIFFVEVDTPAIEIFEMATKLLNENNWE